MLFMDFFGINEETHLSEYDFPRMIEPEEIDQSTVDPKFDQFDELVPLPSTSIFRSNFIVFASFCQISTKSNEISTRFGEIFSLYYTPNELDIRPPPDEARFDVLGGSVASFILSKSKCCFFLVELLFFQCLSLLLWLEERYEAVYMRHPGFQKGSKPLLALDNPFPMELPENLFGDKWAFVQLPISAVREEVSSLETRLVFGAGLDLDLLGIEIDDKTLIPGLAVATSHARPLAAWMNGLEVCSIEAELSRASLILSVGIPTRYIYATYKKTPVTTNEAEAWEAAKKACGGLHFLAIQEDLWPVWMFKKGGGVE
ncbi:hypothetical protein CMV_027451 [Castanea mollissima]|uniref:RNA-binding protein Tab2/Atab2 C-terminal domain-containing protein n=1 Tax=Castanea mollissima TaxID=60419 RepID=A0A8J4QI79_9ROSI|nr:hypothetical protein CMV_027451 [Castanea mollissima]